MVGRYCYKREKFWKETCWLGIELINDGKALALPSSAVRLRGISCLHNYTLPFLFSSAARCHFLWKEKLLSASIQQWRLLYPLSHESVTIRLLRICLLVSSDLTLILPWSQRLKGFQNLAIPSPSSFRSWWPPLSYGQLKALSRCCYSPFCLLIQMNPNWASASCCCHGLILPDS